MLGRGPGLLAVAAVAAACTFDRTGGGSGTAVDGGIDAAAPPDGAVSSASHLLLTEVKTGPDPLEFIEIYNPLCSEIDLSTYYLSDQPSYGLLPSWGDAPPLPGTDNAVVRFPAASVLPAGGTAVIARDGAAFAAEYGFPARFALTNPATSTAMEFVVYRTTPDLVIANAGEPVALFEWDGERDLVSDVDILIAGEAPTAARQLTSKADLAPEGIDGPDADATASIYHADDTSMPAMLTRDALGSYHRVAFEEGFEEPAGGNGLTGHDETSENTRMTWEQEPDSATSPGDLPQALLVSCPRTERSPRETDAGSYRMTPWAP